MSVRARFAWWLWRRWASPRVVGYLWRTDRDVYMINPREIEVIHK